MRCNFLRPLRGIKSQSLLVPVKIVALAQRQASIAFTTTTAHLLAPQWQKFSNATGRVSRIFILDLMRLCVFFFFVICARVQL